VELTIKPMIYVAGPITKDPFGCVRKATPVFHALREAGWVPFLPQWSIIQEMIDPVPYEAWLAYDFDMILHCQALLRLPGESPGADREVQFARDNGVPVLFDVQDADA